VFLNAEHGETSSLHGRHGAALRRGLGLRPGGVGEGIGLRPGLRGLGYCSVKYALKRSRSKFVLAFGQPVRV
jgi:hypothetical protein